MPANWTEFLPPPPEHPPPVPNGPGSQPLGLCYAPGSPINSKRLPQGSRSGSGM